MYFKLDFRTNADIPCIGSCLSGCDDLAFLRCAWIGRKAYVSFNACLLGFSVALDCSEPDGLSTCVRLRHD